MGFRFYRRLRGHAGVTLNLSKGGISTSLGVRGAHVTLGGKGIRTTVGLPGTGMYWTEQAPWSQRSQRGYAPPATLPPQSRSPQSYQSGSAPTVDHAGDRLR